MTVESNTIEQQKSMARRLLELWDSNNNSLTDAESLVAKNYQSNQNPYVKGQCQALSFDDWTALVTSYREAFSNSKVETFEQVAQDNLVSTRWQITATQTAPFQGRASSSTDPISWTGISIDRIDNGKIVESWVSWDMYTFMLESGHLAV